MAKLIFLSHRDQREDEHGYPEKPEEEIACSRYCDFHGPIRSWDDFGEPSICPFGCVLGCWLCGVSLSVSHPWQLPYDFAFWGRLLIRDNQATIGSPVNVIVLGLALRDHNETEEEGNRSRTSNNVFHRQPPRAIGRLSLEDVEQRRCR